MKFTYRDIVWIAIVTLIIIYLSKCHRDNTNLLEQNLEALRQKTKQDSIIRAHQLHAFELIATEADQKAKDYSLRNKQIEQESFINGETVIRLTAALKAAKKPLIDTTTIAVGQEYLDYCDSLAEESSNLAVNFKAYRTNTDYLIGAKDASIKARDSIIAIEHNSYRQCKADYNTLKQYCQAYKQSANSSQIYLGAELIGNPTSLISNAGIALTLKTKTNKLWQISGGLQSNGSYYARINGNILIKLKN